MRAKKAQKGVLGTSAHDPGSKLTYIPRGRQFGRYSCGTNQRSGNRKGDLPKKGGGYAFTALSLHIKGKRIIKDRRRRGRPCGGGGLDLVRGFGLVSETEADRHQFPEFVADRKEELPRGGISGLKTGAAEKTPNLPPQIWKGRTERGDESKTQHLTVPMRNFLGKAYPDAMVLKGRRG